MKNMEHNDAIQIIQALQKQNESLNRIATASERTNEILLMLLSPAQKQTLQKAGVDRLVKNTNRSRRP